MSRLSRRFWTEEQLNIKSSGGLFDLFDNYIKHALRITDDEYDHILEIASDEEMTILTTEKLSLSQKRELIHFLNKNINYGKNNIERPDKQVS